MVDIILVTCISDGSNEFDKCPNVDKINEYLLACYKCKLNQVDNLSGGDTFTRCDVFMASIKDLQIDHLKKIILGIQWEYPERVQLFTKGKKDNVFLAQHL